MGVNQSTGNKRRIIGSVGKEVDHARLGDSSKT